MTLICPRPLESLGTMNNFSDIEIFSSETDFVQVGDRDYIQGIHITQTMAETVFAWRQASDRFIAETIKFNRKILCNGRVFVCSADHEERLPKDGASLLYGKLEDGQSFVSSFVPDQENSIRKRIEKDDLIISPIMETDEYSGDFQVSWHDSNTYLKTLIEADKRAILNTVGESPRSPVIEVTAVEDLVIPRNLLPYEGVLTVKKLGVRTAGSLEYILSAITWTGEATGDPVRLTFSVKK